MKAIFSGVNLVEQILIYMESDDCSDELLKEIYLKCYPKQTVTIVDTKTIPSKFEIDGIE